MILIVTNKQDEHADIVIAELHARGIVFERVNTEDFPCNSLAAIEYTESGVQWHLDTARGPINVSRVQSVWYRRPVRPIPSDEITDSAYREFAVDQSAVFLEGLWLTMGHCLWVNDPVRNRIGEHKQYQLSLAREIGLTIPDTLIGNDPRAARSFAARHGRRIVIKPAHQFNPEVGRVSGKLVGTHLLEPEDFQYLDDLALCPAILQEYIEKDVELRITVIGDEVFAAALHSQETDLGRVDWRRSLGRDLRHERFALPATIRTQCLALVRRLGLAFGAIDMILTPDGRYVFLEINPNGQWCWIEHYTGMPMVDAMARLLSNGR